MTQRFSDDRDDSFPIGKYVRRTLYGLAALFAASTALGSFYTVDQGEVAYVRHLGQANRAEMVMPGLHWKMPFLQTVDEVSTTQKNYHVEAFTVNTIDNQRVTVKVNVTYDIPKDAVYRLLYEVGKIGSADISDNIAPIVKDRTARVFSGKNTNNISSTRDIIQNEIQLSVHDSLNKLFSVNVVSLQIESITYSEAFNQSNDTAVLAKNRAVQEENQKKVVEYQAQQKIISAQGERDQAIAKSEGEAKAIELAAGANFKRTEFEAKALVLQAEADKKAKELRGAGDGAALKSKVEALNGPTNYVAMLNAEAAKNWTGGVPQMMFSGDSKGFQMPLILNQSK